jgi:hypothetical protein
MAKPKWYGVHYSIIHRAAILFRYYVLPAEQQFDFTLVDVVSRQMVTVLSLPNSDAPETKDTPVLVSLSSPCAPSSFALVVFLFSG